MDLLTSLKLFKPEAMLCAGTIFVLVFDLLARRSPRRRFWTLVATIHFLSLPFFTVLALWHQTPDATGIFSSLISLDRFALFFKALFLLAGMVAALLLYYSSEFARDREGEGFALLLGMTLAMCLLAGATHALMLFLALEFLSLTSYLLTAFKNHDRRSTEAALKYTIYGALASGIMLFGFSYLYGLTGELDLRAMGRALSALLADGGTPPVKLAASVSLMMVLAGFCYKIAAVPFHMWCPDVYEGAPTPVTALLSVGPKAAGFAALLRFCTFVPDLPWPAILGLLAAATMTLGNLAAIGQDNVKRMLAYSSIAHAGYLLLGVCLFTREGTAAVLFYLAIYVLMNLGAFLVVVAVREETGREDVEAFRGLASSRPVLAVTFTIFLFSLVGIPPLGGFIAKFYLFAALLQKAGYWYYVLALVGVLNSAISLYYYARVVKAMFLQEGIPGAVRVAPVPWFFPAAAVSLAGLVLVLGVYWVPLQSFVWQSLLTIK